MAESRRPSAVGQAVRIAAVWGIFVLLLYNRALIAAWGASSYIYTMLDGSWVSTLLLFILLISMPECSPVVFVLAAMIVATPEAWWLQFHDTWLHADESVCRFRLVVIIAPALVFVVYWINGLLLVAMEMIPAEGGYIHKYKIQPKKMLTTRQLPGLMLNIAGNLGFVVPCIAYGGYLIDQSMGGLLRVERAVPTHLEMAIHMALSVFVNEVLFYYGHWLFHANKTLYKTFHKVHHEFTAPNALAAVYCHPVELVLSDFLPLGAGIFALQSHYVTGLIWILAAVLGTQTHHCGYRWPWIPSHGPQPNFHDVHHEKFNVNYGNLRVLDMIHGTMAEEHVKTT